MTVSHYRQRGDKVINLTGVERSSFCPLVPENDREDWEAWTIQNQGWLYEDTRTRAPAKNNSLITPFIYADGTDGNPVPVSNQSSRKYHAPTWQMAPVNSTWVNFDVLQNERLYQVFNLTFTNRTVVHGGIEGISGTWDPANSFTWPSVDVVGPIFNSFRDDSAIVAILASVVHWHLFFQNIAPEGTLGIVVVVENTCGEVVTYTVTGSDVAYLGPGDLHEATLDSFEATGAFRISESLCSFALRVYPSRELYDSAQTNKPFVCTIAVLGIVFLSMAVFLVYDCFNQKRQEKLIYSAARSNAIVR